MDLTGASRPSIASCPPERARRREDYIAGRDLPVDATADLVRREGPRRSAQPPVAIEQPAEEPVIGGTAGRRTAITLSLRRKSRPMDNSAYDFEEVDVSSGKKQARHRRRDRHLDAVLLIFLHACSARWLLNPRFPHPRHAHGPRDRASVQRRLPPRSSSIAPGRSFHAECVVIGWRGVGARAWPIRCPSAKPAYVAWAVRPLSRSGSSSRNGPRRIRTSVAARSTPSRGSAGKLDPLGCRARRHLRERP